MSKGKARWKDTLPPPTRIIGDDPRKWGEDALWWLRLALINERTGHPDAVLVNIRYAAADVRAWRKSLPKDQQGVRHERSPDAIRSHLVGAISDLMVADLYKTSRTPVLFPAGPRLRYVEAHLRTAGGLLIDQEAAELVGLEAES